MPQPPQPPKPTANECEQACYDTYVTDLEKAKGAATRHFLFIPYTDSDVYEPLAEAAKDKYKRCVERCKGLT